MRSRQHLWRLAAASTATVMGFGWVMSGSASADAGVVVLPLTGPPGSSVMVDVNACPAATTAQIQVQFVPDGGGSSVLSLSGSADAEGRAQLSGMLPSDTPVGSYTVQVTCLDAADATIDTGSTPFQVQALRLTLSPTSGPRGTRVRVSGSFCPLGVTESAIIGVVGASDEVPPFDPSASGSYAQVTQGSFAATVAIPSSAPLGENQFYAYCVSEGGSPMAGPGLATFNVTEGTAGGGGQQELPASGTDSTPLALAGALVLLAGAVLVATSRRRAA